MNLNVTELYWLIVILVNLIAITQAIKVGAELLLSWLRSEWVNPWFQILPGCLMSVLAALMALSFLTYSKDFWIVWLIWLQIAISFFLAIVTYRYHRYNLSFKRKYLSRK